MKAGEGGILLIGGASTKVSLSQLIHLTRRVAGTRHISPKQGHFRTRPKVASISSKTLPSTEHAICLAGHLPGGVSGALSPRPLFPVKGTDPRQGDIAKHKKAFYQMIFFFFFAKIQVGIRGGR